MQVKKISKLLVDEFSFNRNVIPVYSIYDAAVAHFEYGRPYCKGTFLLRNLNDNIIDTLRKEPFDIVVGQNGVATAKIFLALVDKIDGKKAYFSSGCISFRQEEKKGNKNDRS